MAAIIAVNGRVGSGKTSTYQRLLEHGFRFAHMPIADTLKDEVCQGYGCTRAWLEENKNVARPLLIGWAELRRNFDQDYWINKALARIAELPPFDVAFVDDMRYVNEAEKLREAGALLIQLVCPADDSANYMMSKGLSLSEAVTITRSASESSLEDYPHFDLRVQAPRSRSLDEIYRDVVYFLLQKGYL